MKNIAVDFYYDQPVTHSLKRSEYPKPQRLQSASSTKHLSYTVRDAGYTSSSRPVTASQNRSDSFVSRERDHVPSFGGRPQSSPSRRYNNNIGGESHKTVHVQNSYARNAGGYAGNQRSTGTSPIPTRGSQTGNKFLTPTRASLVGSSSGPS